MTTPAAPKLTDRHMLLIRHFDSIGDGCNLVGRRRNNGTLELWAESATRPAYHDQFIARMHVRDHKAFWALVNEARTYLAGLVAERQRVEAAREYARTFEASFNEVRDMNARARQLREAGGKVLVHVETRINPHVKSPWRVSAKEIAVGTSVTGYREAVNEYDRQMYKECRAEMAWAGI